MWQTSIDILLTEDGTLAIVVSKACLTIWMSIFPIQVLAAFKNHVHRAAEDEENSYSTILVCHGE